MTATRVMPMLLLAILGASLLVSLTPSASAQLTEYFETFDDDAVLDATPEQDGQYTMVLSNANAFVSAAQASSGTQSYTVAGSGATGLAAISFLDNPAYLCTSGYLFFKLYMADLPAAGGFHRFLLFNAAMASSTSSHNFEFSIGDAGQITLFAAGSSEVSTPAPTAMPLNQWVDIRWTFQCTGATAQLGSSALNFVISADGAGDVTAGLDNFNMIIPNGKTIYVDDISWGGPAPAPPPFEIPLLDIPPTSTRNQDDISGFSMDFPGNGGIIRYDGGRYIKGIEGSQLALTATAIDTHCNRQYGVAAQYSHAASQSYVMYLQCNASNPNIVDSVRIRNSDLTSPFQPDHCSPGIFNDNYCAIDLDGDEAAGNQNLHMHILGVHSFPFDYSKHSKSAFLKGGKVAMAWAFTTVDGNAGLVSYVHQQYGDDAKSQVTQKNIDPVGNPVTLACTAHDEKANQDFFYAGSTTSSVKGFRVFYKDDGGAGLEVQMSGITGAGGVQFAKPVAMGCGGDQFVVARETGEIVLFNATSSKTEVLLVDAAEVVVANAMAVDSHGIVAAWMRHDHIELYNLKTKAFVGKFPVTECTVAGMAITFYAKEIYVGCSTGVKTYEIGVYFGTNEMSPNLGADTDNDDVLNFEDPDIDGDGVCNVGGPLPKGTKGAKNGCIAGPKGYDPDVDGDQLCNAGLPDQPIGTVGAQYGCTAGDDDDDGDGVPNQFDTSSRGPGSPAGIGTGATTLGGTESGNFWYTLISAWGPTGRFFAGLVLVVLLAGGAYKLAGPAPMVVGGAGALAIIAAVGLGLWNIVYLIGLGGILGGVSAIAAAVAKKVGGRV